jgi:hypothetical protein
MKCPSCGSPQISRRRLGKDAGSKIGALLGASIAAANAMRGARLGILLGGCIGPFGAAAGGITGAVLSGICTGSVTSAIGGAFGSVADREFLNDCECEGCGHTFRRTDAFVDATEAADPANSERTDFFGVPVAETSAEQGGGDGTRN